MTYKSITSIDQDLDGNILIGGNGGFTIYDNDNFKTFNANDGIPFGYVNTMMVEGIIYGLALLGWTMLYNGKKFRVYGKMMGLRNPWIRAIGKAQMGKLMDRYKFWIINTFDGHLYIFKIMEHPDGYQIIR